MKMAFDLAQPGSERTVVTGRRPFFVAKGDRVAVAGAPRSVSHHVAQIISATAFEMSTYHRPSKGFRKHLRRMKAAQR